MHILLEKEQTTLPLQRHHNLTPTLNRALHFRAHCLSYRLGNISHTTLPTPPPWVTAKWTTLTQLS